MITVTFCGGSESRATERDNTVITMWGGTDILLPTLAEKMLRARDLKSGQTPRILVITVMGATLFKYPTLAREIESLKELKASGALTREEMIRLWREVASQDDLDLTETITFMGASGKERPSKKEELKDLERIAARGLVGPEEFHGIKSILEGEIMPLMQNESLQEKLCALIFPEVVPELPTKLSGYLTAAN